MTRARDIANQGAGTYGSITADDLTVDTTTLVVDDANDRVGIGTSSPGVELQVVGNDPSNSYSGQIRVTPTTTTGAVDTGSGFSGQIHNGSGTVAAGAIQFLKENGTVANNASYARISTRNASSGLAERMRIDSSGAVFIGRTTGLFSQTIGLHVDSTSSGSTGHFNRVGDGGIVRFGSDGTEEGSVSISGTTVSYNGGHLARWSRLLDDSKDTSIVKGTVMTNLDAMVEWGDEDNEQLNKMAVSSVEGDANVAGVFVNWDEDDDWNDMNIAMTGDMVIRIAQGTTVARGDLLMSAGDGTAKPQGDDIVRSKTIAKVTSTHVSHTYDDGSYLVPCVLMAC